MIRAKTLAAIKDIRRLVYGLRPPALDGLGLVLALRQQAAALGTDEGRPLRATSRPMGLVHRGRVDLDA